MHRPYDELYNRSSASLDMEEPTLLDELKEISPVLLIPVGLITFPIFLLVLIPALGLTLPLLPVMAILYGLYFFFRHHRNRWLVWGLRIIVILATAAYVMLSASLHLFEQEKVMYPLKCFVYTHGVNSWEVSHPLLPDKLPEVCEDYQIITQGQAPAQDYHPSLYLMYHTDTQTLHEYEEWISSHVIAEHFQNTPPDLEELGISAEKTEDLDEEFRRQLNCPKAFPRHVYDRLKVSDNLDNAVIYVVNEYYDKGCLLNYETGLVVFWL